MTAEEIVVTTAVAKVQEIVGSTAPHKLYEIKCYIIDNSQRFSSEAKAFLAQFATMSPQDIENINWPQDMAHLPLAHS